MGYVDFALFLEKIESYISSEAKINSQHCKICGKYLRRSCAPQCPDGNLYVNHNSIVKTEVCEDGNCKGACQKKYHCPEEVPKEAPTNIKEALNYKE